MHDLISLIKDVHENVYTRMEDDSVNIFLCGANEASENTLRKRIQASLQSNPKLSIVFPEWLFPSLMRQSEWDLLSLEKDLAENVDVIILPLECLGAICELGVFSSFQSIVQKMIVLNESKHKRARSFIAQGPIRLVRKHNSDNVLYYNEGLESKTVAQLKHRLDNLRRPRVSKEVVNLFNFYRFIGLLLLIIQPVDKNELEELLVEWNPDIRRHYIGPSLEILIEKKHIDVHGTQRGAIIRLTKLGYSYYMDGTVTRVKSRSRVVNLRSKAIWIKERRHRKIDFTMERARLLDLTQI